MFCQMKSTEKVFSPTTSIKIKIKMLINSPGHHNTVFISINVNPLLQHICCRTDHLLLEYLLLMCTARADGLCTATNTHLLQDAHTLVVLKGWISEVMYVDQDKLCCRARLISARCSAEGHADFFKSVAGFIRENQ